jgi:nucleoid DNA-binding protein
VTKSELIKAFAKEIGITLRDAEVCVNTLFNRMADTLAKGGRVEIRGFGSFKVKEYEPYSGRNPCESALTKNPSSNTLLTTTPTPERACIASCSGCHQYCLSFDTAHLVVVS